MLRSPRRPTSSGSTEVALDSKAEDPHAGHQKEATTLYVWASDQAGVAADFLAVIAHAQTAA